MTDSQTFQRAIDLFDAANAADPNQEMLDGKAIPKELLYAQRMSEMLERFAPDAVDAMKLAVRGQHLERWKIPRSNFPMDRTGYLMWRTSLYKYHAETAGRLMKEAGYDDITIARVQSAIGKRGIKVNPESQMLEDMAGLVFIEHYMLGFAGQHPEYDEAKWIGIIRKTWKKLSAQAREFALGGKIRLPEALVPLILKSIQDQGAAE